MEKNARISQRLAMFELGQIFIPVKDQVLPDEKLMLTVALSGQRSEPEWDTPAGRHMDFFDLKGILETLLERIHIPGVRFQAVERMPYHPGKCAAILHEDQELGVFGELHPLVKQNYDFGTAPVLAAELDMKEVMLRIPDRSVSEPVPSHPPVLEDLAVIVEEDLPAVRVYETILQAGGNLLKKVRLFDVFRGEQIGEVKKSLAYSLTYQAQDRTLTDKDATQIRQRIIRKLEQDLGAKIRS